MRALLVVDMIHDFVDGKYGSESAKALVPKIRKIIEKLRSEGTVIVYLKDAHDGKDPELSVWGEHAMRGTVGSEIVESLSPAEGDIVVEKHTYDGFLFTDLHETLQKRGIKDVFLCGVATDICVLHTAFGAFARGYNVNIISDLCAGTSEDMHNRALSYMRDIYGAKILESESL